MNMITQRMRFRQAVIEYSKKYSVTKAAIRYQTKGPHRFKRGTRSACLRKPFKSTHRREQGGTSASPGRSSVVSLHNQCSISPSPGRNSSVWNQGLFFDSAAQFLTIHKGIGVPMPLVLCFTCFRLPPASSKNGQNPACCPSEGYTVDRPRKHSQIGTQAGIRR